MSSGFGGSATIVTGPAARIRADGPCLRETLAALGSASRSLDLDRVRTDALDLTSRVVDVYVKNIGAGEVGADGSAKSSAGARSSTGLLYGRVQSGKTMAMIGFVAAAIDNGFRVVIVLTSDNLTLASQTTERFRAALDPHGPITRDALAPHDWASDTRHLAKHIASNGVLFVCSKNKKRLDSLERFLVDIGAPDYPALILDDEADQATPDTNVARRSRAKERQEELPDHTAIHEAVVRSLRSTLRHNVFLQVTATPYVLLLQTVGEALRPQFVRLLEPGNGYTGGDVFFEREQITEDGLAPPLAEVEDSESDQLLEGVDEAPDGLKNAISFFLVAATAQGIMDPESARSGQNFLCHTSQLRKQHRNLETLVRDYVARVEDALGGDVGSAPMRRLAASHADLLRTCPSAPSFDAIVGQMGRRIVGRKVVVVNAETDASFGRSLNLIVGGNILGRGVTIENLLVTYYLREPKVGQMDTMLQHARMYGYRTKLMPFTRVFLPLNLALRFQEIHRMEQRLRRQLAAATDLEQPITIDKSDSMRVTRHGALDPGYVDLFDPEDQRYPPYPQMWLPKGEWETTRERIAKLLGGALRQTQASDPQLIDFDELLDLVETFPYVKQDSSIGWVPNALCRVLERQRSRCNGRAFLFAREMHRRVSHFVGGALSGDDVRVLRQHGGPVFCAFWDQGKDVTKLPPGKPPAKPYWFPTLVFDAHMPRVVVNVSPT